MIKYAIKAVNWKDEGHHFVGCNPEHEYLPTFCFEDCTLFDDISEAESVIYSLIKDFRYDSKSGYTGQYIIVTVKLEMIDYVKTVSFGDASIKLSDI